MKAKPTLPLNSYGSYFLVSHADASLDHRVRCWIYFWAAVVACTGAPLKSAAAGETFVVRGYYTTFMRMPTFGLLEWQQMIEDSK